MLNIQGRQENKRRRNSESYSFTHEQELLKFERVKREVEKKRTEVFDMSDAHIRANDLRVEIIKLQKEI